MGVKLNGVEREISFLKNLVSAYSNKQYLVVKAERFFLSARWMRFIEIMMSMDQLQKVMTIKKFFGTVWSY